MKDKAIDETFHSSDSMLSDADHMWGVAALVSADYSSEAIRAWATRKELVVPEGENLPREIVRLYDKDVHERAMGWVQWGDGWGLDPTQPWPSRPTASAGIPRYDRRVIREQKAVDFGAIRDWARANGQNIGARGRMPRAVLDSYKAAASGHACP